MTDEVLPDTRPSHATWGAWRTLIGCSTCLILGVGGCSAPGREEIARKTSPSGRVDAVLVETNGGATTAFGYEVYIVPAGDRWGGERKALVYKPDRDVRLRWAPPARLLVDFKKARIAQIYSHSVTVNGELIQIELLGKEE